MIYPNKKKSTILLISLIALAINLPNALATVIEIEVKSGGYKLQGPQDLTFGDQAASFTPTVSEINTAYIPLSPDSNVVPREDEDNRGLTITDENGGTEFSVTADVMTALTFNSEKIPNTNFYIQNSFDPIDTIRGTSSDLSLDPSSDDFVAFCQSSCTTPDTSQPVTIANGTGQGPGKWRIFPQLRIEIPGGQAPGLYTTTLIFTIT